jgi:hypothetical protein
MERKPLEGLHPDHEHIIRLIRALEKESNDLFERVGNTLSTTMRIEGLPVKQTLPHFTDDMFDGTGLHDLKAVSASLTVTYDHLMGVLHYGDTVINLSQNGKKILIEKNPVYSDAEPRYTMYPVDEAGLPMINEINRDSAIKEISASQQFYALSQFGIQAPNPRDPQVTWADIVHLSSFGSMYQYENEKLIDLENNERLLLRTVTSGSRVLAELEESDGDRLFDELWHRQVTLTIIDNSPKPIQLALEAHSPFQEPRYDHFGRVAIDEKYNPLATAEQTQYEENADFADVGPSIELITKFRDVIRQALLATHIPKKRT